jgi:hypothetical protein
MTESFQLYARAYVCACEQARKLLPRVGMCKMPKDDKRVCAWRVCDAHVCTISACAYRRACHERARRSKSEGLRAHVMHGRM